MQTLSLNPEGLLGGRRVLDLANSKGSHCARVLSDLGAGIIKIEPPDGDSTRRLPPFKDDIPHPENSLYFAYYNLNKKSITVNLQCADGQAVFKRLVEKADVVLETFQPGTMERLGLDYSSLKQINPGIIMTSITGFGQTGPRKDYTTSELVGFATGGTLFMSGDPEQPPCVAPGHLGYDTASIYAAMGTLLALYYRSINGEGQHIDVSIQEAVASTPNFCIPIWSYEKRMSQRFGSTDEKLVPTSVYRCKNGHVRLMIVGRPNHWKALVEWMGNPEPLTDPFFLHLDNRAKARDFIESYVADFFKDFTKEELYEEGQRRHIPITPVNTCSDFINNEQTKYRGYFNEVNHPDIGSFLCPGASYKCEQAPWQVRRPAPRLGEHNDEVYVGELGYTKEDLIRLKASGAI